MMDENMKIHSRRELTINEHSNQQIVNSKRTLTTSEIQRRLVEVRKREIGSDQSLVSLIRKNNKPDDEAIAMLVHDLTKYSLCAIRDGRTYPDCEIYMEFEDFFHNFYHYSLYMYAADNLADECIDDLLLLAQAYQRNPETFRVVVENDLPIEMLDDFQDWIGYFGNHPKTPQNFEDVVMSAVTIFCRHLLERQKI